MRKSDGMSRRRTLFEEEFNCLDLIPRFWENGFWSPHNINLHVLPPMKRSLYLLACSVAALIFAGCAGPRSSDFGVDPVRREPPQLLPDGQPNTRVILQCDGGGILGITPAIVLAELERRVNQQTAQNRPLGDRLSLCSGASTGAIITSLLAARVRASTIEKFYLEEGVQLFRTSKKPFNPLALFRDKFYREPFLKTLGDVLATNERCGCRDISLKDLPAQPVLVVPAFELRSGRTFVFESREPDNSVDPRHGGIMLSDLISWSGLSAAYYFGSVKAPDLKWDHYDPSLNRYPQTGAVFQDGGQGTQNNTLGLILLERVARNWERDPTVLISMGTGGETGIYSYPKAKSLKHWQQVIDYSTIGGNQAKREAWQLQVLGSMQEDTFRKNMRFYRFNYENNATLDDASDASVEKCKKAARDMIADEKFNRLVKQLVALAQQRPPTYPGDQMTTSKARVRAN